MKTIAILLCGFILASCSTEPTYLAAESSELIQANHAAVDKLMATTAMPIVKEVPLLVATLVNIDSLNHSSRLGRLVSEQIATRLTQKGYSVIEMKLRGDVYIREGAGELLLSRDVRNLSRNYDAQVVIVGNYAVASHYVYLTLKAVTVSDNRVIAAINYVLPLTGSNRVMLGLPYSEAVDRPR